MKISGIYKIQSLIKPNRCYIGSAVKINHRWNQHLSDLRHNRHPNKKLQAHYNKYGEADLQFSVLLGCEKTDLIKTEQYFIDSYKPSFNISQKAGSQLGYKHTPETILKIKKVLSEMSPETKKLRLQKITLARKGKPNGCLGTKRSIESRMKMREKALGNKNALGTKLSEERKQKIREHNLLTGRIPPSRKGIKDSEETRRRKSEGHKGINTWMKGRHPSMETIKKRSESLKITWSKKKQKKSA